MLETQMITRRHLILASAALAAVIGKRTDAAEDDPFASLNAGRYLPLYNFLSTQTDNGRRQIFAMIAAMVGDEAHALLSPDEGDHSAPDLTGATATDAIEAIVAASRGRQVVMINEAHTVSMTRTFNERLLIALRREGFAWLAAETFRAGDGPGAAVTSWRNGMAVPPDLGFYTKDPVFAEAVRSALKLGYQLANYETRDDQNPTDVSKDMAKSIAEREQAEADNLIETIFSKDPKARVLVWCGHGHLQKHESPDGRLAFAARFMAKTGIEPLTVDQSASWPALSPKDDVPRVHRVLERFSPKNPVIVRMRDSQVLWGIRQDYADLTVFHPRLDRISGRPGWLASAPARQQVQFTLPRGAVKQTVLVQCLHTEEGKDSVPADQYLLGADARNATFFLRAGRYDVRLETEAGYVSLGSVSA